MKLKTKVVILIIVALCMVLCFVGLYRSQNPTLLRWKKSVKYIITYQEDTITKMETVGLDGIESSVLYEDNRIVLKNILNPLKDNKRIYATKNTQRIVNYTDGYILDLPKSVEFDFSLSPIYIKGFGDGFDVTISREISPYEDVDEYIAYYLNRFILSETYQKENRIEVSEYELKTKNKYEAQVIFAKVNESGDAKYDGYVYAFVKTDSRVFYRIMFRYDTDLEKFKEDLEVAVNSFKVFSPIGEAKYDVSFKSVYPKNWSVETKEIYQAIKNAKAARWGIFAKDIYGEGIEKTVPQLEKKTGYNFPVILSYVHFGHNFPTEFMQKNYKKGKIVELTYQITENNNEALFGYTPNLDVYRGLKDEEIRKFARAAKEFGHTFLFRLNNEMNSDWTDYSGIVNMSDPEIYVANWQRIYRIFSEEGVDNAIWIYNPNDNNYPPCNWNNFLAYYPGDEYVQMIGVTGYNVGTYYNEVFGETWREFEDIYDEIQKKYMPFFKNFPWIITEFASSSVGGDKVRWMEKMFKHIDNYPNIKIAVWFSYADYDFRPEFQGKVARPYWLDETDETLKAFKKGIKNNKNDGWN